MSAFDASIDDLSHVDAEPTTDQRQAVDALIQSELDQNARNELHPSLRGSQHISSFSPAILEMHDNIEKHGQPRLPGTGIETSRYESLEPPSDPKDYDAWRQLLRHTNIAQSYVDGRLEHLRGLEAHGTNAWLIGNFQTENVLRALEQETNRARAALQDAEEASRQEQVPIKAELEAMQQNVQTSLGRSLEAEIETENNRRKYRRILSGS